MRSPELGGKITSPLTEGLTQVWGQETHFFAGLIKYSALSYVQSYRFVEFGASGADLRQTM